MEEIKDAHTLVTLGKILEDDVTAKHPAENSGVSVENLYRVKNENVQRLMIVPGVEFTAVLEPQAFQAQITVTKLRVKIVTILEVENHEDAGGQNCDNLRS